MAGLAKCVFKLPEFTVQHKRDGWYYAPTARLLAGDPLRGPYPSIVEVSIVIARQLRREIEKPAEPPVSEV